jgi:hypothetical protein
LPGWSCAVLGTLLIGGFGYPEIQLRASGGGSSEKSGLDNLILRLAFSVMSVPLVVFINTRLFFFLPPNLADVIDTLLTHKYTGEIVCLSISWMKLLILNEVCYNFV